MLIWKPKQKSLTMIYPIDSDNFVYSCGAYERQWVADFGKKGLKTICRDKAIVERLSQYKWYPFKFLVPLEFCKRKIDMKIKFIREKFNNIKKMQLFLSPTDDSNFRVKLAKTKPYKGNRTTLDKPEFYVELREYLVKEYGAIIAHGEEADDAVVRFGLEHKSVICSNDKDVLYTAPGVKFNYDTGDMFKVSVQQAWYNYFVQVLTGDTGDNVPGCKRIGALTAPKLISLEMKPQEMYTIVRATYLSKGHDLAYLHEQASLLWIRRKGNDNYCDYIEVSNEKENNPED